MIKRLELLLWFSSRMRSIKIAFNQVEKLRARAAAVIQELQIRNQLNDTLHRAILSAKSVAAIEHVVCSQGNRIFLFTLIRRKNNWFEFCFVSMGHLNQQVKYHSKKKLLYWVLEKLQSNY